MVVALDQPNDEEEIYHARGDEVSLARPLLTGDVVEGVNLPGQESQTAMVVAHPCSMRRGVDLAPKLVCAPVTPHQHVTPEQWGSGFVRIFPLSNLEVDEHFAARLDELVAADSDLFQLDSRTACLEQVGIFLLQQRLIHSIARCKVTLSTIRESMDHVLTEAELQEDWIEDLSDPTDPASRRSQIEAFDAYLIENDFRTQLLDPNRRSQVVSAVAREITCRVDLG